MARVTLEKASLTFQVTRNGPVRLRDWLIDRLRPQRSPILRVHALREVDLALADGDRLGIVGHNGAGKSTLLKVLADVYPLTSGRRDVEGCVSSLFDLSLGFEMDATGRENIAFRGYLQGETRRGVRRKMQEVAEFSELGRYLDVPVRYYSDGMRIRLAFSIATAIHPDVLLIDEAFNAGDASFRRKARNRLSEVMQRASIVVAVSHDHDVLTRMCDRVLWLDQGQVRAIGRPSEVIEACERASADREPGAIAA
jgi:ABC-type polysaccharide/polyol phosphate transport system ATPase subunit